MSKPHKCPVCEGHGTVSRPPNVAGDQETWTSSDLRFYDCPACNGTGLVWEPDASHIQPPWKFTFPREDGVTFDIHDGRVTRRTYTTAKGSGKE